MDVSSLHKRDAYQRTPLYRAAEQGQSDTVQALLHLDPSTAMDFALFGDLPLHVASRRDARCVELLLPYSGNVNAVDCYGSTPLMYAASNGKLECCRLLLEAGATVNQRDKCDMTPLYLALLDSSENRPVIELLLEHGAKLDCVDYKEAASSLVSSDEEIDIVPDWVMRLVAHRNACRAACTALLQLARRRSLILGGNGRDVLRLISRIVWASRKSPSWAAAIAY